MNELRKYQGNSNNGVSSGSPVNNGNVPTGGNLAVNINNAIVRLNQTLTQLNQSISRLATTNNLGLTKTQLVNGGIREFASPIAINEEYRNSSLSNRTRRESRERMMRTKSERGPLRPDPGGIEIKMYDIVKQHRKSGKNNTKEQGPDFNRKIMTGFAGQYVLG